MQNPAAFCPDLSAPVVWTCAVDGNRNRRPSICEKNKNKTGTLSAPTRLESVSRGGAGSTLTSHYHPSVPAVAATHADALYSSPLAGYRSADSWSSRWGGAGVCAKEGGFVRRWWRRWMTEAKQWGQARRAGRLRGYGPPSTYQHVSSREAEQMQMRIKPTSSC